MKKIKLSVPIGAESNDNRPLTPDEQWLELYRSAMDRQWGDDEHKDVDWAIKEADKIYKAMQKATKGGV